MSGRALRERAVHGPAPNGGFGRLSELSVVDHHFDQFGDLVPREVTRI
jgi:hypothetical protein